MGSEMCIRDRLLLLLYSCFRDTERERERTTETRLEAQRRAELSPVSIWGSGRRENQTPEEAQGQDRPRLWLECGLPLKWGPIA